MTHSHDAERRGQQTSDVLRKKGKKQGTVCKC